MNATLNRYNKMSEVLTSEVYFDLNAEKVYPSIFTTEEENQWLEFEWDGEDKLSIAIKDTELDGTEITHYYLEWSKSENGGTLNVDGVDYTLPARFNRWACFNELMTPKNAIGMFLLVLSDHLDLGLNERALLDATWGLGIPVERWTCELDRDALYYVFYLDAQRGDFPFKRRGSILVHEARNTDYRDSFEPLSRAVAVPVSL